MRASSSRLSLEARTHLQGLQPRFELPGGEYAIGLKGAAPGLVVIFRLYVVLYGANGFADDVVMLMSSLVQKLDLFRPRFRLVTSAYAP